MAIVQRATLTPSKMELIEQWLPRQSWFMECGRRNLRRIGSFRFDDPEGKVGIETILVASGRAVLHVPMTYRGSPVAGADEFLIGNMEHSHLGTRWVYDAAGDAVYISALAAAILRGQPQADQFFEREGKLETVPQSVHLHSPGKSKISVPNSFRPIISSTENGATSVRAGNLAFTINRVLCQAKGPLESWLLTATWDGQTIPVQLASAALSSATVA